MPAGQFPIQLPVPIGGVRADVMPYDIPPGFLWRSSNVVDLYGKITTRPGYLVINPAAPDATRSSGGMTYRDVNGAYQTVVATLAKWSLFNGLAWSDITG